MPKLVWTINYLFYRIIEQIDEIEQAVLIKLKKQFPKRMTANKADIFFLV
ncbi:hypothetical protein ABES02_05860 [Neobacillus pocheonensis]